MQYTPNSSMSIDAAIYWDQNRLAVFFPWKNQACPTGSCGVFRKLGGTLFGGPYTNDPTI